MTYKDVAQVSLLKIKIPSKKFRQASLRGKILIPALKG
jgi:hypothetical protein